MKAFSLLNPQEIIEFSEIQKLYNMQAFWGMSTSIDLRECDLLLINSKESITQYAIELCDLIKMKRFGDPQVVYFGEERRVEGYTLVQLIETSSITGHFTPVDGSAYLDVFSCSLYNPHEVTSFTQEFFKAKSISARVLFRG